MSKNTNVSAFVETALIAALAMALSLIPDFASWFTPSFGAIPLVFFSLRRGLKYGLLAGLIWGLLHFLLGKVWYLSLSQVLIEYIIAFLSMGVAGLVAKPFQEKLQAGKKKQALILAILGGLLGVGLRYFWHFLAGVIFWASYAPKGMSPYLYSFVVNGGAAGLTLLLVIISLAIIIPSQSKLFLPKKA